MIPERYIVRRLAAYHEKLSRGAKLVYTILDEHAGAEGKCYPGMKRLRELTKGSTRSVRYWIAELRRAEFLRSELKWIGGPNLYFLPYYPVQQAARPRAKDCTPPVQQVAHRTLSVNKKEPPIVPLGGLLEILSENPNASAEGCTLCPKCSGRQWQGRSEKRAAGCGWCSGRGFMWPPRAATG